MNVQVLGRLRAHRSEATPYLRSGQSVTPRGRLCHAIASLEQQNGEDRMMGSQLAVRTRAALAVVAAMLISTCGASAQELVYGSWVPASDYLNSNALPLAFKQIEEETKG